MLRLLAVKSDLYRNKIIRFKENVASKGSLNLGFRIGSECREKAMKSYGSRMFNEKDSLFIKACVQLNSWNKVKDNEQNQYNSIACHVSTNCLSDSEWEQTVNEPFLCHNRYP